MGSSLPPGWREIPLGRNRVGGGFHVVLNRRTVALTKEVRKWFIDRGYERVHFAQSGTGDVAIVGTKEDVGYAIKRPTVNGGIALRRALGINDDVPRRYSLTPAKDFDALLLGEAEHGPDVSSDDADS